LVDNAIKYSNEKGRVQIAVKNRDHRLQITVADSGLGIARKDLTRLFERFYRTDKARSRDMGGTGLGLAIVKHISIAHGGEVTVDSELGRGSTFTITIPQPKAGERPAPAMT
jgi:signal transduction histidine kinase